MSRSKTPDTTLAARRPPLHDAPAPGAPQADGRPATPFLKWAGGKGQLLEQLIPLLPSKVERYFEPFVGSGAVFFLVQRRFGPRHVLLGDRNEELVNCYAQVRDQAGRLLELLHEHQARHGRQHYYEVRKTSPTQAVERAARFIYLNKTCYNGLWRVNSRGRFNVPMGRYARPPIHAPALIARASLALRHVRLRHGSFPELVRSARRGDFVYLDPPYVPLTATASFTGYTKDDFTREDQRRLATLYRRLDARGCRLMLSNSDTPLARELYGGFDVRPVLARRAINSDGRGRGHVGEVVVLNYEPGVR